MAEAVQENPTELRGEAKKEAFHQEAESKIEKFAFARPDVDIPANDKMHVKLAGTDSCRASVQILNKGGDNNLHYHPNMDLIYMVLQGRLNSTGRATNPSASSANIKASSCRRIRVTGSAASVTKKRICCRSPATAKGKAASKRIPVEKAKRGKGLWLGLTEEERASAI